MQGLVFFEPSISAIASASEGWCLSSAMLRAKIDLRQPALHSDSPRTVTLRCQAVGFKEHPVHHRALHTHTALRQTVPCSFGEFSRSVNTTSWAAAAGLTGRAAASSPAAGTSHLNGLCGRGALLARASAPMNLPRNLVVLFVHEKYAPSPHRDRERASLRVCTQNSSAVVVYYCST